MVEPEALYEKLNSEEDKPLVIDIMSPDIYTTGHITGTVNIPYKTIRESDQIPNDRDTPIITVCNRGNLSIPGMLLLKSMGYRNVTSLKGGTVAWDDKGYPVEGSAAEASRMEEEAKEPKNDKEDVMEIP